MGFPTKHGDFPWLCERLPEGKHHKPYITIPHFLSSGYEGAIRSDIHIPLGSIGREKSMTSPGRSSSEQCSKPRLVDDDRCFKWDFDHEHMGILVNLTD